MRPACPSPRPLAGCRRRRSSVDGDPVLLNPSLPLLRRLSPASTLLRRDPTSAWASAGRRCLLPAYRAGYQAHARRGTLRGPMQTSQGKDTGCTAAPVPNTAPTSVGFWASRFPARSPDRPGLYEASLAFGAAAPTASSPHGLAARAVAFGLWLLYSDSLRSRKQALDGPARMDSGGRDDSRRLSFGS